MYNIMCIVNKEYEKKNDKRQSLTFSSFAVFVSSPEALPVDLD